MTPSTDLFLLIHSLTKAEKGYFKKFREGHKADGHYLKLFDAINAQNVYDEAALKKKFSRESFIKQFPFYKNYLYNLILKSLVAFHSDATSNARIMELIRRTEILIEKGMVVQAAKTINDAKELAIKFEKYALLQDILMLDIHIYFRLEPWTKKTIEKVDELYKEQNEALKKIKQMMDNMYKCNYIYNRYFIKGDVPKAYRTSDEQVKTMISGMEKESAYNSFDSQRMLYYTGTFFYGSLPEEGDRSHYYMKKLVNHFEAHPHHLNERVRNYTDQLYSYMQSALYIGNFKDSKDARTKLLALQKNLPPLANTEFNRLKIPVIVLHGDLYHYFQTGQFERVTEVINDLTKNNILDRIGNAANKLYGGYFYQARLQLQYNIGCLLFYCSDYAKALKWLSMLWNDKEDKALYIEVYHAAIVSVICHYEMENTTSMKYLISTINKSVKVLKKYKAFGAEFSAFMLQLSACKTEAEKLKTFTKMKATLTKHTVLLEEMITFNLFLWMESKLKNKPAALVLKKHLVPSTRAK